jgi:hypothetical protein
MKHKILPNLQIGIIIIWVIFTDLCSNLMIEPKSQKTPHRLIKTTRQWLGLIVVLVGALVLLLESIAVIPS